MAAKSRTVSKKEARKRLEELRSRSRIGGKKGLDYDVKFLRDNPDHADHSVLVEHDQEIEKAERALAQAK